MGRKVRIIVRPKSGVRDPQGEAVQQALRDLGIDGITRVRQGKIFDLEMDTNHTRGDLERMCSELLANPVIEDYSIGDHADDGEH